MSQVISSYFSKQSLACLKKFIIWSNNNKSIKSRRICSLGRSKNILYHYVRLGTEKSLAEKDIQFTDGQRYKASNILIKTLADNLLMGVYNEQNGLLLPKGYLPSSTGIYGLVHMDATQAL